MLEVFFWIGGPIIWSFMCIQVCFHPFSGVSKEDGVVLQHVLYSWTMCLWDVLGYGILLV